MLNTPQGYRVWIYPGSTSFARLDAKTCPLRRRLIALAPGEGLSADPCHGQGVAIDGTSGAGRHARICTSARDPTVQGVAALTAQVTQTCRGHERPDRCHDRALRTSDVRPGDGADRNRTIGKGNDPGKSAANRQNPAPFHSHRHRESRG